MPKITRKKLTRGTKLTNDVVYQPLVDVATAMRSHTLDGDNIDTPHGTFRINLNIPFVPSAFWTDSQKIHLCLPFTLPPLQDEISAAGTLTETSTTYTLTEFGISFDQRAEPASIVDGDHWSYDAVAGNEIVVVLAEKRMLSYDTDAPLYPEREVASFTLDGVAFSGRTLRLNPFLMTGMSKEIHPYRSYMVMVNAPKALANSTALVSLNITMKFRTPLKARDTVAGGAVQNMPTVHNGAKTSQVIAVTPPVGGTVIRSEGATGLGTEIGIVDAALGSRLEGGYLADGDVPVVEHLATDSCYEVIAVPLWQNFGPVSCLQANLVDRAAWINHTGAAGRGPIIDYRRIPIDYPFVLHHVIAVSNYAAPAPITTSGARHPTGTQLFKVGVLMGTGIRGDFFQYEQLAYLSWQPSQHDPNITIDRLKNKADGALGQHISSAPPNNEEHDYELISVPLASTGAATAVGPRTMVATGALTS